MRGLIGPGDDQCDSNADDNAYFVGQSCIGVNSGYFHDEPDLGSWNAYRLDHVLRWDSPTGFRKRQLEHGDLHHFIARCWRTYHHRRLQRKQQLQLRHQLRSDTNSRDIHTGCTGRRHCSSAIRIAAGGRQTMYSRWANPAVQLFLRQLLFR